MRKPLRRPTARQFETKVTLYLTCLPVWQHLPKGERKKRVSGLHGEILEEHAEKRAGVAPGWKRRLTDKRSRCLRPEQIKKSKRPKFHAATKAEWVSYVENWNAWRTRYHAASARLLPVAKKRPYLAVMSQSECSRDLEFAS